MLCVPIPSFRVDFGRTKMPVFWRIAAGSLARCSIAQVLLDFVTPMNDEIAVELKRLVRLQAVELERTRLTAALKALPGELAAADNQLKTAQKKLAETEAALKREELLRARLELDIAGLKAKAARHKAQMDTARNAAQAEALEHEIEFSNKEATRLEDSELASMELTETLEAERSKAAELAAKLTETLGLIRARIGEQQLEFTEQLVRLKQEREVIRPEISAERLAHFDRVAGSKGTGLARADGQQCSGCRMGIRPQLWNQLRDGALIPCESCNRILYFEQTMDIPPAKTPQGVMGDQAMGGISVKRRQTGVS